MSKKTKTSKRGINITKINDLLENGLFKNQNASGLSLFPVYGSELTKKKYQRNKKEK